MGHRDDLITMGFSPDRVDWAIRDTPVDGELQARLDHLFEHENQPVPALQAPVFSSPARSPTAYAPPVHPPPFVSQQPAPIAASTYPTTPFLTASLEQMSLGGASTASLETYRPSAPTYEDEAVQRYRDFLAAQRDAIRNAPSDKLVAKDAYFTIMKFFSTEGLKWRERLRLSAGEADFLSDHGPAPVSNGPTSAPPSDLAPSVVPSPPAGPPPPNTSQSYQPVPADASSTVESNTNAYQETPVHYPISIYDPTRTMLPISEPLATLLGTVFTAYYEDEPVEELRTKTHEIRPRMTDQISNMRWQALSVMQTERDPGARQRRSEQHYARLGSLHTRGDWEAATRLEEEYKEQERRIREQDVVRKHHEYRLTFLEPARDSIHAAFKELHPIYAELQRILEEENRELDVVRAVSALEELSDLMERGMTELETMEDDRREKELEMQRQLVMDDSTRSDPWGDADNVRPHERPILQQVNEVVQLEKQKKYNDKEIRASRAEQKVDRRSAFFSLAFRRMGEAIAGVDRDKESLTHAIQETLEGIPDAIPLEQEEARAKSGDIAPSKVPLPSKELYDQIREAHSTLLSVNTMCNNMRVVLKSLQQNEVTERRARDLAQLELDETRMGRADSWYFGAGRVMMENGEKEDEAGARTFEQGRSERMAKMAMVSEPVLAFLTQCEDREMAALKRLGTGMTANGPMSSASSLDGSAVSLNVAAGGISTATFDDMQKVILMQQQTQMISNMM